MTSLILLGLFAGVLSGLLGVGGGIILVPGMILLLGIDAHKATATSLAIIIPTAIVGSIRHWGYGNTDMSLVLILSLGTVAGVLVGAWLSSFVSDSQLTKIFGCFVIAVGISMLIQKRPDKQLESDVVSVPSMSDAPLNTEVE